MKNYYETDPEFMERFENFTFNEVVNEQGQTLDDSLAIWQLFLHCLDVKELRI